MKKIFIFSIMCLFAVFANAQGWVSSEIKADEFKGTKAYTAYSYSDDVGVFVHWSNDDGQYKLISYSGMFNYDSGYSKYGGSYCGISVLVGIYDNNDKLIEKFKMWLDCDRGDGPVTEAHTRNAGGMSNPVGQGKKVKKILKHLNTGKGYVRFYADLYDSQDFDFKVPCKNN